MDVDEFSLSLLVVFLGKVCGNSLVIQYLFGGNSLCAQKCQESSGVAKPQQQLAHLLSALLFAHISI